MQRLLRRAIRRAAISPGDRVQVRDDWPERRGPCHIRTPHYLRGRAGTVERVLGAFPNPEEPGALDLALALAHAVDADLVIANHALVMINAARAREETFGELAGPVTDPGDRAVADLLSDLDHAEVSRDVAELRAIDAANPQLGVAAGLSERAAALYPQTQSLCLANLQRHDRVGIEAGPDDAMHRRRHGTDDRVSNTVPGKRLGDVGHQQRRLARCASAHSAIPHLEAGPDR